MSTNPMIESLKLKAHKYYQEQIEKFMKNKLYVEEDELELFNVHLIAEIIQKNKVNFPTISDEDYLNTLNKCLKTAFHIVKLKNALFKPRKSHAIGIDLGTTNSCVAYFRPTDQDKYNVVIIPNDLGENTTPSVVSIREDEEIIGQLAKEELYENPKSTIISVKRLIGRKFSEECVKKSIKNQCYTIKSDNNENAVILIKDKNNREYFPEEISSKVLKKLKDFASAHIGVEVSKAVITVPAYFSDSQKEATIRAGKLAGLQVLRIINEPTAAAIAYRLNWELNTKQRNVLVYDFGGGTFDVSVLSIDEGLIDVKAVTGDNNLGGDDFDTNLMQYCLEEFKKICQKEIDGDEGEKALCRLREKCEETKKRLSSSEKQKIKIINFYGGMKLDVEITRKQFEELNKPLISKSIDLVKKALEDSKLEKDDIDDILLVGGSTRMLIIKNELSKFFNGRPLNHSVNPDEAVAYGAAIEAALLNGQQSLPLGELTLSDVSPLSLGIELQSGIFSRIIERNSKLPCEFSKKYVTVEDNQKSVAINVYEGEDDIATKNDFLGKFILEGVPPGHAGDQEISVTFSLNDEGILYVKAKIVSTGKTNDITIRQQKGTMPQEYLDKLLKECN